MLHYLLLILLYLEFDILPDVLNEPFTITTLVGDVVVAKRVYRNCPIIVANRVTHGE